MKKSILVPLALSLYSVVVYAYLLPRTTASGTYIAGAIAANVLFIVLLWWLYRKKEKLAEKRDRELSEQNKKNDD